MEGFELAMCTTVLLREAAEPTATRKSIAKLYRLAMDSSEETDWREVNLAIVDRWSVSGLEHIKQLAWTGKCFQ